jgi:hypothetical protein
MALDPREATAMKALFDAGAHTKALAIAFGHDQRTIRKMLRSWTREPIKEPPLYTRWQRGLSADTQAAIQGYFQQLSLHEQTALRRLRSATHTTDDTLAFPSQHAYDEILEIAQPHESLVALAQRLNVDLSMILLAYAEWREQTEYLQWAPQSDKRNRPGEC